MVWSNSGLPACRQALFWTYATNKWQDEEIDYYAMGPKELDKLAEAASSSFVAENDATC